MAGYEKVVSTSAEYGQKLHEVTERIRKEKIEKLCLVPRLIRFPHHLGVLLHHTGLNYLKLLLEKDLTNLPKSRKIHFYFILYSEEC